VNYKSLGKTGIKVSELCFGTMSFGSRANKEQSQRMYSMCREQGINFFDCANVYQKGVAEEYLGSFIAAERDKVVITTKAYGAMGDDVNAKGCSAKNLQNSLHQSLKRLGTDYVDVFFLHHYDPATSEEEVLRTLDSFVRDGKVLSVGVSNYAAFQVERLLRVSDVKHLVGVQCIQPMYNLAKRMAEVELFPMASAEGMGVITYSPLAGGLLTGRYSKAEGKKAGRLVENPKYKARYEGAFYEQVGSSFAAYADQLGMHPATLGIAWVMANQAVTAPILGAADPEQLKPALDAPAHRLSEEVLKHLDTISPPLPPAHDRTEERS
jgi:aryl-alcohol dehydrogenase-like predicted oxidoreductase